MKKQPTMAQIAKRLDLSRMTVSTVINERTDVFPVSVKTKARITEYLKKIGYVRNFHAMGLKGPKRDVLGIYYDGGFKVHHITEAFNQLIQMTQRYPRLSVEVKVAPPEKCEAAIEELIGRGSSKLIWCMEDPTITFDHQSVFRYMSYCNSVIYNAPEGKVFLEAARKSEHLGLIHFDRRGGFRKIAKRLYDLGHRKVCVPQLKESDPHGSEGLLNLEEWGIKTYFVHPEHLTYQFPPSAYQGLLAEAVIQAKDKYGITAAVFGDDQLAINTMSGLINRGIKVPQDIGITGMDGEPWLQHLQVPLETVAFPVEKAIKRIEGILFEKKKTGCINLEMESIQGKTIAPCKG